MSLYTVSMQCSTYPESPVVDDRVCAQESCLGRPCILCYLNSAILVNVLGKMHTCKLYN